MKRIPVTQASYKKISPAQSQVKGVPGSGVTVGKPDKSKEKQAAYLGWGRFEGNFGRPSMIGASSTFYNNSYMAGGHNGGFGDVPPYIAMLNECNGGVMYYPSTLKEKFEWYRYFYRFSPYVKAAVNLNTDLPMSRLQLRMPKMEDKERSKKIEKFYKTMIDELHLFDKLHSMLLENSILGNAFLFIQYSEKKKRWDKITLLPPEEISVANYPMSDNKMIQYRPEMLVSVLSKYEFPMDSYESYLEYVKNLPEQDQNILRDVSYELVKQMKEEGNVLKFDSDPYHGDGDDKIGSFAYHFTEKRHEYQDWGVSPLECLLVPLLQQTHYQYTQLSLSSRNMTPRNVVTAEGISTEALDDLREQVDQSMLSPDYSVVTNFNIQWDQIGAENRLIDLGRENEVIENQLFAGLGVTREILTGEGLYSGNKISVEIMNTKYMIIRERLQNFVEEYLFRPVALQNGFYEDDEDGNRTWLYPTLGFTRLTIRDNQEVFDQLFQLYQKGSLPIGMILDIFNINSDDVDEELKKDLFTVKDSTYNEMLRQIYTDLGSKIVESTDLAKQVAGNIIGPEGRKLKYTGEDADDSKGDSDDFGLDDEMPGDDHLGEEEPGLESEEAGGSGESGDGDAREYIEQVTGEGGGANGDEAARDYIDQAVSGTPGNAKGYIDRIKEEGRARGYLDQIRENGRAKGYIENTRNEKRSRDYIERVRDESKSRQYIKRVKDEKKSRDYIERVKGDERAGDYIEQVAGRPVENARPYIERSVKEEANEAAREYLDNALRVDRNVKRYLSNFLGDGVDDDFSDDAQSAGL